MRGAKIPSRGSHRCPSCDGWTGTPSHGWEFTGIPSLEKSPRRKPLAPGGQRCQAGILTPDTGIFPALVQARGYFYPALAVAAEGRGFPAPPSLRRLGLPDFIWENQGAPWTAGSREVLEKHPGLGSACGASPSSHGGGWRGLRCPFGIGSDPAAA